MLYQESQRFTQWWLWLFLIAIGILPFIGFYHDWNQGQNPFLNIELLLFALCTWGLVCLFFILKLKTTISHTHIHIRFVPFLTKNIPLHHIKSARILNYGFVGGWGIRYSTTHGTVYNTSGKIGLALVLRDNSKLVIGTQCPKELQQIIMAIGLPQ